MNLSTLSVEHLDALGNILGIPRNNAESNEDYSKRLTPVASTVYARRPRKVCGYCGLRDDDHGDHCSRCHRGVPAGRNRCDLCIARDNAGAAAYCFSGNEY